MKSHTFFSSTLFAGQFRAASLSKQLGMLALCLLPTAASADLGLFVLGGAQTTLQNFAPYINATALSAEHVLVRLPDTNPFTANHLRDMNQYQNDLEKFLPLNSEGVVLFAYSGGAKFAARLALDNKSVRGIFLMDPVDGPPPFTNDELKFPTVLKPDTPQLDIPVFIIKSERGGLPGFLGVPCVSKGNGPDHFVSFVDPAKLQFYTAPGASHLDFLEPPLKALASAACARSKEVPGATRANALVNWTGFWQNLKAGIEAPQKAFLEP